MASKFSDSTSSALRALQEFTIKTDPENMDYVVEGGAKANFELYKEEKKEKDELSAEKEEGEKYDAMKKLENKTKESKRAMDILDALDEIRTNNARNASVGIDDILQARDSQLAAREHAAHTEAEKELELEARQAFAASRAKRVRDDDEAAATTTTQWLRRALALDAAAALGPTAGSRLQRTRHMPAAAVDGLEGVFQWCLLLLRSPSFPVTDG